MPKFDCDEFEAIAENTSYDHFNKQRFHRLARARLVLLAAELKLSKSQFTISTNPAGPAVSGETTLYTDFAHVQVSAGGSTRGTIVMYRAVKTRKDYCGFRNWFGNTLDLADPKRLAAKVVSACQEAGRLPRSDGTVPNFNALAYA